MGSPYKDQLDRIEKALIGNGREGLIAQTARIEESQKATTELAREARNAASIAAVKASDAAEKADDAVEKAANVVTQLSYIVTTVNADLMRHVGTDHISVLIKKKGFWTLIVLGFITLHLLATYVPNLWDGLMILLGIPKLVLPLN